MIEKLTDEQKVQEHIMLGLRCKYGIDENFLLAYGYDIEKNENVKKSFFTKIKEWFVKLW